jgi:diguanylate cyclase (GGDEF)-like protein/PAS domain S-box-containing protein
MPGSGTDAAPTSHVELAASWSRILGAAEADTLDVAIETSLEQLGRFGSIDLVFAILVDDDERITDDWRWDSGHDLTAPAAGSPLRATFASAIELLRLGHVVALEDLHDLVLSPSERALADRNGLRAIALAPIRTDRALLGVVGAQVLHQTRRWERSTLAALELLAGLTLQTVTRTRQRGALAAADARARRVARFVPEGLVTLAHSGHITWASPSFTRLTKQAADRLEGTRLDELVHPDQRAALDAILHELTATEGIPASTTVLVTAGGGTWRWADLSIEVATPEAGLPDEFVALVRDVHDRHLRAEELMQLGRHDPLTGLANRAGADAYVAALGAESAVTLALLDLDGFKSVNDQLGHEAGDTFLRTVAAALQRCVRASDLLVRLGGDEFLVLSRPPGVDAASLGARLVAAVREAAGAHGGPAVTASVGVAGPGPAAAVDELRRQADQAMYRSKRAGGDRFELVAAPG